MNLLKASSFNDHNHHSLFVVLGKRNNSLELIALQVAKEMRMQGQFTPLLSINAQRTSISNMQNNTQSTFQKASCLNLAFDAVNLTNSDTIINYALQFE